MLTPGLRCTPRRDRLRWVCWFDMSSWVSTTPFVCSDPLDQHFLERFGYRVDSCAGWETLREVIILTAKDSSQTCVDYPNDDCDPQAGGADCRGICVYLDGRSAATTSSGQICGGFAGIKCPAGKKCVDNPNDSCDPNKGGRDCAGICV